MPHCTRRPLCDQIDSLRQSFGQTAGLPFAHLLAAPHLQAVATAATDEPIYPALVTLSMFLSQVFDADHSCMQAVARLLAERALRGDAPCAAGTGAYCKAR